MTDQELIAKIKDLGFEFEESEIEYLKNGYSGGVFKVGKWVIKKIADRSDWDFYQEILKPFNLKSPKIYQLIETSNGFYLLLDYIPHTLDLTNKEKFTKAVDYLLDKDTKLKDPNHFKSICLEVRDNAEYFLSRLEQFVDKNIHPSLTKEFMQKLRKNEDQFHQTAQILMKGRLTVVHNDFQMKNILFSDEDFYVIDWSRPNIGSVCFDLAKLVTLGPAVFEEELINRYREKIDFAEFDECFKAAKLRVALTVYEWNIEALASGFNLIDPEEISKLHNLLDLQLT